MDVITSVTPPPSSDTCVLGPGIEMEICDLTFYVTFGALFITEHSFVYLQMRTGISLCHVVNFHAMQYVGAGDHIEVIMLVLGRDLKICNVFSTPFPYTLSISYNH
jgi:hypothetical protein